MNQPDITRIDANKFDFILNSIRTLYSNPLTIKMLHTTSVAYDQLDTSDEDPKSSELEITKCGLDILEHLFHSGRRDRHTRDGFVGYFLNSIRSFHKRYRCSTKTAICLSIFLWKRACAADVLNASDDDDETTHYVCVCLNQLLEKVIQFVKSNFTHSLVTQRSSDYSDKKTAYSLIEKKILLGICRGDERQADVLHQLLLKHDQHDNSTFERDKIVINMTKSITNKSQHASTTSTGFDFEIVNGIVLNHHPSTTPIIAYLVNKNVNALMFDSSLRYDHVHLGFNKNLELTSFLSPSTATNPNTNISFSSPHESWKTRVKHLIDRLDIRVILVRGTVDAEIRQWCETRSVAVFSHVDASSFERVVQLCEAHPVVYIEDIVEQRHVFRIQLEPVDRADVSHVRIAGRPSDFFTILIETNFGNTDRMIRESLEHNLSRLANILADGCYLVSDRVERLMCEILREFKCDHEDDERGVYFDLAKEILGDAFSDLNSERNDYEAENNRIVMCDDLKSKTEAWRLALHFSTLFLNSDFSICY